MSSGEMMESNSPPSGAQTPRTARGEGEEEAEGRGAEAKKRHSPPPPEWYLSPLPPEKLVGLNTAVPVPIGQPSAVQTPPPEELVGEDTAAGELVDVNTAVDLLMPKPLKMSPGKLAEYLAIKKQAGQEVFVIGHHKSHYHKLFEERFYFWGGEQDRQEWDLNKQNKTEKDVQKMLVDRLRDVMRPRRLPIGGEPDDRRPHANLFKRNTSDGTDEYQLSIVDAKQYSQRPFKTWQRARVVRDYLWNKLLKRESNKTEARQALKTTRGGAEDEFDWVLVNGEEGHEDELEGASESTQVAGQGPSSTAPDGLCKDEPDKVSLPLPPPPTRPLRILIVCESRLPTLIPLHHSSPHLLRKPESSFCLAAGMYFYFPRSTEREREREKGGRERGVYRYVFLSS